LQEIKNRIKIKLMNIFNQEPDFNYQVSKSKVIIYWNNKRVLILKDNKAQKFLDKFSGRSEHEVQLTMAKLTGNFKRGNEK